MASPAPRSLPLRAALAALLLAAPVAAQPGPDKKPAPVKSDKKPAPAKSDKKPAPAKSDKKPAPAKSDKKPAPTGPGEKRREAGQAPQPGSGTAEPSGEAAAEGAPAVAPAPAAAPPPASASPPAKAGVPSAVWPPPVTSGPRAAAVTAAPPAPAPGPGLARDGHPLAGYQNGHFYLRDATDNFRLYPSAMLLLDGQVWAGPGVSDLSGSALGPRLVVRAARLGLGGEVLEPISWQLTFSADGQPLVNGSGTNELSAAPPGQVPDSGSARYAPAQTAGNSTHILDAWVNLRQGAALNLMLGQYRTPFTMANLTPLSALPFHERPLSTRVFGNPGARDIGATVWGDVHVAHLSYWVGVYGGDGINRPGVDRRADVMARVTWSPLAGLVQALEHARIGVSARLGSRQGDRVNYDYPDMYTQQGFVFWRPVYTDSLGRSVHVIPADTQGALAFELWVPVERFDLRSELVLLKNDTREAVAGYQSTNTERIGDLHGAAGYVQLGYTILGKPRLMGAPGRGVRPRTLDFTKKEPTLPHQALEVLLRVEALGAKYSGASRGGQAAAGGGLDGDIEIRSIGLGVNYWATRHVRMSANWLVYQMPGSAQGGTNRAVAPGNLAGRTDAHTLQELGMRIGVMF